METRRRSMACTAIVVVLILAGCASDDEGASEDVSSAETTTITVLPTAESTPEESTTAPSTTEVSTTIVALPTGPAVFKPDAEILRQWFTAFEPGTYRSLGLGTPLSFTAIEPLNTQVNGQGMFVLSDLNSVGPDDQDLVLLRVSALSDPTQPQLSFDETDGWPATDFAGWLDNVADGIIVSEPEETSLGGLDALVVDLELGDIECGSEPGYCLEFATNVQWESKALSKNSTYRIWMVEQGGEAPIAVIRGIDGESDEQWLQRAENVLSTIAFGDVRPNPMRFLSAGPTDIPVLGGIRADVLDGRFFVIDEQGPTVFFEGTSGFTEFVENPLTLDGVPLTSVADVVAELESFEIAVEKVDTVTVDGAETQVFDVVSSVVDEVVMRRYQSDVGDDELGWYSPEEGRVWLIDHPERGVLMVAASAFAEAEKSLAVIIPWAEHLIETMEFVSPC